jgi:hypothetical protein
MSRLLWRNSNRATTLRLPLVKFFSSSGNAASPAAAQVNSRLPYRLRTLVYLGAFGGLGLYSGYRATKLQLSTPLSPGTEEDVQETKRIRRLFGTLPIVQELRRDSDYAEWEAYSSLSEELKKNRLTSGPMKGSRGLALQVVPFLIAHAAIPTPCRLSQRLF